MGLRRRAAVFKVRHLPIDTLCEHVITIHQSAVHPERVRVGL
jgi:hypothetical protein